MLSASKQVAACNTQCKVCGNESRLVGVVDFSKCGLDYSSGKKVIPYSGIPIYYYSCSSCLFTFTEAFDGWSHEDFAQNIYNDDYVLHDPEYLSIRPKKHAEMFLGFSPSVRELNILDYGSGLGILEKELRQNGFDNFDSYDPFTNVKSPKQSSYDLVVSFEVFEHHPNPKQLFEEIKTYLKPNGALFFATLKIDQSVIDAGLSNWWYCVPKNGHISFYSYNSLMLLANKYGFKNAHSFNDELHVFFNSIDDVGFLKPYMPTV